MPVETERKMKTADKFIETICIKDGNVQNLAYHNLRMNRTRKNIFETDEELFLEDYIRPENYKSVTRCRVVYGERVEEIAYIPYQMRPVHTLRLVFNDNADYHYKSVDRSMLNQCFAERGEADDVLIVRNGLITDTSIANVALFDGSIWYTPAHPLLQGTCRQSLLDQGNILERDIDVAEIHSYQRIRLFNAMIPFGLVELDTFAIK